MWPIISKFWVALATAVVAAAAAVAAADLPLPGGLSPDHPVRLDSFIAPTGRGPAPVELLGFDVEAGGERIGGGALSYDEGVNPVFTLYWIPRETPQDPLSVLVRVAGSGPRLEQAWPVEIADWRTGVVNTQRAEFSHPRGRYSGKATLSVVLQSPDAAEYVLYTAPLFIRPSAFSSKVEARQLEDHLGRDVAPLNAALRLGEGASATLPVEAGTDLLRGLAIVSATGYDGAPVAGEDVCRIEAGDCLNITLKTGVMTGPNEPFRYRDIGGPALPVEVFSQDEDKLDYVVVIEFNRPCRPSEIEFTYLKTKGVIDIKAVALLKSHEAP